MFNYTVPEIITDDEAKEMLSRARTIKSSWWHADFAKEEPCLGQALMELRCEKDDKATTYAWGALSDVAKWLEYRGGKGHRDECLAYLSACEQNPKEVLAKINKKAYKLGVPMPTLSHD